MDMLAAPAGALLDSIAQFCQRNGIAESTFGRRAVNDGKFVARLRDGARITPETLQRVSNYMGRYGVAVPVSPPELRQLIRVGGAAAPVVGVLVVGVNAWRKSRSVSRREEMRA